MTAYRSLLLFGNGATILPIKITTYINDPAVAHTTAEEAVHAGSDPLLTSVRSNQSSDGPNPSTRSANKKGPLREAVKLLLQRNGPQAISITSLSVVA